MFPWSDLKVLCLGGAGQVGLETCRQLVELGADTIIVHDLTLERAEEAIESLRASVPNGGRTTLTPSGGNVFHPQDVGTWSFPGGGVDSASVCADVRLDPARANDEVISDRPDLLERLFRFNMGRLTPELVRRSLLWRLVAAYRPAVVVDTVNTATALGYRNDVIRSTREIHGLAASVLEDLGGAAPPHETFDECAERMRGVGEDKLREVNERLFTLLTSSFRMSATLNTAAISRYVQCLNALFDDESAGVAEGGTRVPELWRYVKVHTTGLGGMGFNVRYTHGDRSEPGLSTSLLGKVCVAGSTLQLLLALAHTPGRDVRVVVPATLVGWKIPEDFVVRGSVRLWSEEKRDWVKTAFGPLPEVDTDVRVPCDGSTNLAALLKTTAERVTRTSEALQVPYIRSGENQPYAVEDLTAVTALGQMGCITKEEVSGAVLDCIQGDSRYDVLAAMDASHLLPTQSASVLRDRTLRRFRSHVLPGETLPRPSVSLGNVGPKTAKQLYEIELIRSVFPTVREVVLQAPAKILASMCGYVTSEEGAVLRRQILSIGIPIVMRRGLGQTELLLGRHLTYPDDLREWDRPLRLDDPRIRTYLANGWVDLSYESVAAWHDRFKTIERALGEERVVHHDWFDPSEPFRTGELLGFYHSISGGDRKPYM